MTADSSSNAWGRVAEDGTVYVRTADGERAVGSWQAGSPAEGLAHFGRRYDDLVTEVDLLEQRLATGAADPQHSLAAITRLRNSLAEAAVVGDLAGLGQRLDTLAGVASEKVQQVKAERAERAERVIAAKRALAEEAEDLAANSTDWKAAGERIREIMAGWRELRGGDRKTDTELWHRVTAAKDAFHRRRGSHFAQLDQQRKEAQARKEELVREAESLADSTDWGPTAARLKALMTEWKASGRAPREAENELWTRFRAAQDRFFGARSAVFAERDAGLRENQTKKEALIAEAAALDVSDVRAAQDRLRDLQERYDRAGKVPRDAMARLDAQMRAAEQRVRDAVDARWHRSTAASNPLLSQMREQVAKAERQVERARASGDSRRVAEAEAALATRRQFLDQAERSTR